jgi:quinoprotein glucose dehydrogenase
MKNSRLVLGFIILAIGWSACSNPEEEPQDREWKEYLGGPDRNHYSVLDQINADNVHLLEMAWIYHTTDSGQTQCNPIIVDGVLYGMTAKTQPFALNAATGEEYWRLPSGQGKDWASTSRGLVYWEEGEDKRILYTNGEWLYAIDARTGKPISKFGDGGKTSLKLGLGPTAAAKMVISNTPGTVFKDLIIMPLRVSEGVDASLGHIQAFNIKTGELAWVFKTIPESGEEGYETWPEDAYTNKEIGAANNWAGMAVDRKREIVYVPTGSAAYDFYGGNRIGSNLFANTLLALDANTGKRIWHFQLVHHDILDRDPPAPPNLMTLTINGKKRDAVAQVTKQGLIFIFDRETGEPLFPIEERPVPASDIPGEIAWPTQPFPVKPAPFARQVFTEADINPYAENREELIATFRKSRYEGPFTPLTTGGTIIFPGLDGGAEWGGAAVDKEGIMYVNSNEMPWRISLGPTISEEALAGMDMGKRLYTLNCTPCHGPERKGNPASGFPSLENLSSRSERNHVADVITNGKGMMPAFRKLSKEERLTLVAYLFDEQTQPNVPKEPGLARSEEASAILPYQISGYTKFLDKNGYPAVSPPWGTLNAIDLNTGEYLWKIPYGEYQELIEKGLPITGAESYGGPVVTASGLLFIAGTKDGKFRAYDKKTGKLLWETQLPSAAFATPSTYEVNGRQYVVVACGGTKLGAAAGDSYVAFALPENIK